MVPVLFSGPLATDSTAVHRDPWEDHGFAGENVGDLPLSKLFRVPHQALQVWMLLLDELNLVLLALRHELFLKCGIDAELLCPMLAEERKEFLPDACARTSAPRRDNVGAVLGKGRHSLSKVAQPT